MISFKIKKYFLDNNFGLLIAIILFSIAVYTNNILEMIIYMLYFIIFLEIVRAVISYIVKDVVEIRFLVDAFIILTLREFIVNIVKINNEEINSFNELINSSLNLDLLILSSAILFLFFIRYLTIKTNPKVLETN